MIQLFVSHCLAAIQRHIALNSSEYLRSEKWDIAQVDIAHVDIAHMDIFEVAYT